MQCGCRYVCDRCVCDCQRSPVPRCYVASRACTPKFILNPQAAVFTPNVLLRVTDMISDSSISNLNHCRESSHILSNLSPETSEYGNDNRDIYSVLDELRKDNVHRVICSHININSIRYKIEMLSDFIKDKIDILRVEQTKIDESFPSSSFIIKGFAPPFRKDRIGHGGGILLYVREDIPAKELKFIDTQIDLEIIFIEIIIHKTKWLIGNFYNPDKSKISNNLEHLSKHMNNYLPFYDNIILHGDFNAEMSENAMIDFCDIYNLKNLIKDKTCFKNVEHPSLHRSDLNKSTKELPKNCCDRNWIIGFSQKYRNGFKIIF